MAQKKDLKYIQTLNYLLSVSDLWKKAYENYFTFEQRQATITYRQFIEFINYCTH